MLETAGALDEATDSLEESATLELPLSGAPVHAAKSGAINTAYLSCDNAFRMRNGVLLLFKFFSCSQSTEIAFLRALQPAGASSRYWCSSIVVGGRI